MFCLRHDQAPLRKHRIEDTPREYHAAHLTYPAFVEDLVDFQAKPNTQDSVRCRVLLGLPAPHSNAMRTPRLREVLPQSREAPWPVARTDATRLYERSCHPPRYSSHVPTMRLYQNFLINFAIYKFKLRHTSHYANFKRIYAPYLQSVYFPSTRSNGCLSRRNPSCKRFRLAKIALPTHIARELSQP